MESVSNIGSAPKKPEPVIIKKYANRRLYNTASSSYVTLETLAEMVRDDIDFLVVDAKSGEDLTRPVLTQIIVEQEAKGGANGQNLLPIPFLRQLISLYGDNMQYFVPNYLEQMMQNFTQNQNRMQDYVRDSLSKLGVPTSSMFPFGQNFGQQLNTQGNQSMQQLQQIGKQNMEIFQQAMKMFMPFPTPAPDASTQEKAETLEALKQKVASLEAELKNI